MGDLITLGETFENAAYGPGLFAEVSVGQAMTHTLGPCKTQDEIDEDFATYCEDLVGDLISELL